MRKPAGRAYQDLVALVAKAFDPGADVKAGEWIAGPDGRLDMDVSIRGKIDGKPALVVIECKDYDLAKTGKVDRAIVDALDSKRHDLNADIAIISSNSGFTKDALSKCARKGIGAISVLSEGDERVKVVIEKEIYFRKVKIDPIQISYQGDALKNYKDIKEGELKYESRPVDAWLQLRASLIASTNPEVAERLKATFNLKPEAQLEIRGEKIHLESLEVSFTPRTQWYSQIVELDAALGLYDYLRGKIRLAGGENRYTIKGVNFDTGVAIESAPKIERGESLLPGETNIDLVMVEGLGNFTEVNVPKLENLILPEDLDLKVPDPSASFSPHKTR